MNTDINMHIVRTSSTSIHINNKIVNAVESSDGKGLKYVPAHKDYKISLDEWDALMNFLISERELQMFLAESAVNVMLKELGIPKFYES